MTLTGRAPRGPAVPPHAARSVTRRGGFSRKLDNFRLFSGFTHQDNTIAPANRADFCIIYLWAEIIKRCLKKLKIPVNAGLKIARWPKRKKPPKIRFRRGQLVSLRRAVSQFRSRFAQRVACQSALVRSRGVPLDLG